MLIGNKLISQVPLLLPVTVIAGNNEWSTCLYLDPHILSLSFFLFPSLCGGRASGCWFVWLRSTHHISQIFVAWEKHFLSSLTGGVNGGDYERCKEASWNSFEVSKSSFYGSVSELSTRNDILIWVSREQINFLWSYYLWCFNAPTTTDLITEKCQMKVIYLHVYKHTQIDNFAFYNA